MQPIKPLGAATLPPLRHVWRECICIGRAYELLRADLQQQLRFLQKTIGYRHIRFHGTLHDDVGVVHRRSDGSLSFSWTQLDAIYDFIVEIGLDPIVEINPMPAALASEPASTMFWYKMNVSPPADWNEWSTVVLTVTQHFVERYGISRVRRWWFEVWNEPDLSGFWSGDSQQYFLLYAEAAAAVKSIDASLRVGGPASASPFYAKPFLEACRRQNVPIDFISYHGYPQNEYCSHPGRKGSRDEPGQHMPRVFRQARDELAADGRGELPILVTEWNTQHCDPEGKARWVGNIDVSRLFSAAATAHYATACDDLCDALAFWVASDIFEEGGPHWEPYGSANQHYGMLTVNGVPKPAYHVFRFLSRMTGTRYPVEAPGPAQCGALLTNEIVATRALLWNFHMPEEVSQRWVTELQLPVPETLNGAARVRVTTARIAAGAGSAFESWKAMGAPAQLTQTEHEATTAWSCPRYEVVLLEPKEGAVTLPVELARDEVLFVDLGSAVETSSAAQKLNVNQAALDQALHVPDM